AAGATDELERSARAVTHRHDDAGLGAGVERTERQVQRDTRRSGFALSLADDPKVWSVLGRGLGEGGRRGDQRGGGDNGECPRKNRQRHSFVCSLRGAPRSEQSSEPLAEIVVQRLAQREGR